MKILITGAGGMLGRCLADVFGSAHDLYSKPRTELDVTSLAEVRESVRSFTPDWILHAAAYTKVDKAETERSRADLVNGLGTRNVAVAAFENGCRLLYYSTDYVFDGKKGTPYTEWDEVQPVNYYGRSKLAGENAIRSLCPAHLILRTSWLFGPYGPNFVEKILELAATRESLSIVDDQQGSPTFTVDLAYTTLQLVEAERRGTYHVTNSGQCSWYEFACEIVAQQELDIPVRPIPSREFPVPARRPTFSVLDNHLLRLEGFDPLRKWQEGLADYLRSRHG